MRASHGIALVALVLAAVALWLPWEAILDRSQGHPRDSQGQSPGNLRLATVRTTSGALYRGEIIEDTGRHVVIRTSGQDVTVARASIESIALDLPRDP
jgi:hypothetical protein